MRLKKTTYRAVVSVQTARKTKYSTYIQVLDQLRLANATRISVAERDP